MFLDEIAVRLVAQGVGTIGSTIFMSSKAILPAGDGPYITLTETGGSAPTRIQNQVGALTQRPSAQIAVRAATYPAARTLAKTAYLALDGIWNATLSGVKYHSITARQEPTDIGLDGAGRAVVAFNILCEKAPS